MKFSISKENAEKIRKFEKIRQRGFYCNGAEVTEVYNEIFKKTLSSTTCGACISSRIKELVCALQVFEEEERQNKAAGSDKSDEVEQYPTKAKKTPQKQNKKAKKE